MRNRFRGALRFAVLATLGVLAGCGAPSGPGNPIFAGGGDCASMKSQMDRLGGQGKSGTKEYKAILDRYLYDNCYR